MLEKDTTRLDQNALRVDVGAIVTVANTSTNKRQHYFIYNGEDTHPSLGTHAKVDIVKVDDPFAQVMMGKMVGDKVFFRHNLVIEFIEWPGIERMVRK